MTDDGLRGAVAAAAYLEGDFGLRSGRRSRVDAAVCVIDREEGGADALARQDARLRAIFRAGELPAWAKTPAKPHG